MPGNGGAVFEMRNAEGVINGYVAGFSLGQEGCVYTPDSPVNALKEFLTSIAQTLRQEAEELGVMVGENVFSTDISSQVKYVGILVYASMDKNYSGTWKTVNNGFVTLDSAGVVVMCVYVMAYIQVCFAWEQYVLAQIAAATTVEQLQAIDLDTGRPAGQLPGYVVTGLQATIGALGAGALQGTSLTVTGTATATKFKGSSGTPAISAGPGAGDTASVGLSAGSSDSSGQINVVAAGTIDADTGAIIASVTFDTEYATAPFVVVSAANAAAGAVANAPYVSSFTTGFSVCVSSNAGLTPASYLFNYVVMQ